MAPAAARPSRSSDVVPERSKAHNPTSTRACLRASAALDSITPAASTAGTVFGMSTTVVTPPAAAAAVNVPKSSFCGKPGSRLCTWTSIAPGSTYMPRASTVRASSGALSLPTAVMTPPAIWTSTSRGPSGVCTVPPTITIDVRDARSVKLEIGEAEKRRVGKAGGANVVLAAFAAVEDDHQVNHGRAGVAQHLRGTKRVAARGDDILDDGDPLAGFVAAFDLFRSAVTLRLLPHQDQGEASFHGDCTAKEHCAELRSREALRLRRDQLGETPAEPAQERGIGFEEELVEVAVGAFARAKHEVALEI